jgi:hypothetical protein
VSLGSSPPGTRDPSIGRDRRPTASDLENSLEFGLHLSAARGSRPSASLVSSPPGTRNQPIGRDLQVAKRPNQSERQYSSLSVRISTGPQRSVPTIGRFRASQKQSRSAQKRRQTSIASEREPGQSQTSHLLLQATCGRLTDHRPSWIGHQMLRKRSEPRILNRDSSVSRTEKQCWLFSEPTLDRLARSRDAQHREPIVTNRLNRFDWAGGGSTAENRCDEDRQGVRTGGREPGE